MADLSIMYIVGFLGIWAGCFLLAFFALSFVDKIETYYVKFANFFRFLFGILAIIVIVSFPFLVLLLLA